MSHAIMLDPAILLQAESESELERFLGWVGDRRVHLGSQAWRVVSEKYAEDSLLLSASLMRLARRAIGELLARGPLASHASRTTHELSEAYTANEGSRDLFVSDLVGLGENPNNYTVGTDRAFWADAISSVSSIPPPPSDVQVHLSPHLPTPEERREHRARFFSGRRILIIGGQVETNVVELLNVELGIKRGLVRWIPSEKHKRARNLSNVIKGLPADAIVICVVGKVGHDVSGEVKNATSKASLELCETRYASQMLDTLRTLCHTEDSV